MNCLTGTGRTITLAGTFIIAGTYRITRTGVRRASRKRMTTASVRSANLVAGAHHIACAGTYRYASADRMTGATAHRFGLTTFIDRALIRMHDVHFLIRNLDVQAVGQ